MQSNADEWRPATGSMPKRILFIETVANGVLGGSTFSLRDLVHSLDRRRFEPYVVLYSDLALRGDLEKVCKVILMEQGDRYQSSPGGPAPPSRLRVLGRFLFHVGAHIVPMTLALSRIIRRERIDLVHNNNLLDFSLEGILAAKVCGIPCVVHQRGIGKVPRLARLLSRYVDVLICISDAVREFCVMEGVPVKRIERVYNGVEVSRIVPSAGPDSVRGALGFARESPVVGIVGTIQRWKGQREVILAVSKLRERFPEIRCLIVGGVYDPAYDAEIRNLTEALGITKNICFLGHRTDIVDIMNAMDIVIHASIAPEPFGRVLIEAMALGKPLVASKAGGPMEIVQDHVTGLLVPPGDVEAMVKAVSILLESKTLAAKMGAAGRRRVEQQFALRKTIEGVARIYETVL